MTLKRIPGGYLREALDVASQLAHAKEAHEIEWPHVLYGAFHKLRSYQKRIMPQEERSSRLDSIFERICDEFEVPRDLPEKNGASNSFIVEQLLNSAYMRAIKSGRRFVLLEDVIVVLLNSREVMKLFIKSDVQFLTSIREWCMRPRDPTTHKRTMAVRPQYNTRKQRGPKQVRY